MRTMKLIDVTLREGAAIRGRELTFKEKLEIARSLDRLKADTIELAPIGGSKAEELSNSTIASMVSSRISACVNIADGDIEKTWNSIRIARKPKLNLLVPVSPVQMEYICHKKDKAMLSFITEKVKECRYFCEHVEFSALDATRAEKAFLCEAITAAVKAGAYKVTLCDSAGIMMPQEFGAFVEEILSRIPELSDIELYVEVSDEMRERYKAQAAKCSQKFLYRALKICNDCDLNYRISKNKRLLVELTLIQAAQADEDDDSSGRKPKRLKPIFKKTAAGNQAAPAAAEPKATVKPVTAQPVMQPAATAQTAAQQEPAKPARKNVIPTIKGGNIFTSIYGNKPAGRPEQPHGRQTVQVIDTEEHPAKPLTADQLQNCWNDFAATLPRQDTPLKNRMINCHPAIKSDTSFTVLAGNPMMAEELKDAQDRIVRYIQQHFNNPAIQMEIEVDLSRNVDHILTREEQYKQMKAGNPALQELEKVFGLELRY